MAITKEIFIDVETQEAVKQVDKLNESVERVEKSSKDLEKQNEVTKKGFKGVSKAVKGLGNALKAAGIGLVIAAFVKLGELLSENQKVVDIANTAWTAFGTVVKDISEALFNFDETLVSIGDTLKNIIIERFRSGLNAIKLFGTSLSQLFSGEFESALNSAKQGVQQLTELPPTLVELADAGAKYTKTIIDQADAYVQLTNAAAIAEAQQRRIFEQADRDAEIQRRIRDDFNLTFEERLAASEKLEEILNRQEQTQLRLAQTSVNAAQKEIELKGRTTERVVALINALSEQDAIEADIAGRRAEQEAQQRALEQEILQARKDEIGESLDLANLKADGEIAAIEKVDLARLASFELEKKTEEEKAEFRRSSLQAQANVLQSFGNLLSQFGEESKGLAVAGIIAENIAAAASIVISTAEANAKAVAAFPLTAGQPFVGINTVSAALGIASAGAAAAKAIRNLGGSGGGASGQQVPNAGGAASPSFNVVGEGGVNQLAQTLNQEQDPIQAFVVGSNVTTQQELDRNIIETAEIG